MSFVSYLQMDIKLFDVWSPLYSRPFYNQETEMPIWSENTFYEAIILMNPFHLEHLTPKTSTNYEDKIKLQAAAEALR